MKAVLFDFDGTLVYLLIDYASARRRLKKLFSQFGIESDFRPLIESINDSLLKLENRAPSFSVKGVKKKAHAILEDEELKSIENAKLAVGAREVLSFLKKNHVSIVIVSRNGRKCIEKCITKLNIPKPNLIVSRDDVTELKPSPKHITAALKKMNLRPSEAMLVGDTYHDIVGGKKSGICTVLISHDKKYKEKNIFPNHIIPSLSELYGYLQRGEPQEPEGWDENEK